jgi:hypothetical protein
VFTAISPGSASRNGSENMEASRLARELTLLSLP